jgi:hypothetical protein
LLTRRVVIGEYSYSANKTVLDAAIINGIDDSKKTLSFC